MPASSLSIPHSIQVDPPDSLETLFRNTNALGVRRERSDKFSVVVPLELLRETKIDYAIRERMRLAGTGRRIVEFALGSFDLHSSPVASSRYVAGTPIGLLPPPAPVLASVCCRRSSRIG
jgi:hypothetical protein